MTTLTQRQKQVLFRMGCGDSDKEIAAAFGLAESTVTQHAKELKARLGVRTRVQSVVRGLQLGLLRLEYLKVTP